jgi:hypothetical protein
MWLSYQVHWEGPGVFSWMHSRNPAGRLRGLPRAGDRD